MAFLDETGATILADEVKTYVGNTAVAKEAGKGLSTNDYTTAEKNKLTGIDNGANKTIVDSALNTSSENPVQNKVIYTEFEKKLDKDGDSKDLTNTFVSQDSTNVTQWTDVDVLTSAEKHSSVFNKISTMFKNIRYLYKMLGTADISTLGEGADIGTVTGALSKLNSDYLGIGTWEDLVINHTYYNDNYCRILKVNKTLRLVHISFTTYPGMPNQHGYLTLPKEFIPEYLKGFHGYNGLLVGMHKSENGMIEEILLNGDGELISSHSINAETTESTFVDFWFMY